MSELIAEKLIDIESVQFSLGNHFTLTSGLKSPVYVDCRKIISFVEERTFIIDTAIQYINEKKLDFDLVAGGETAGIPYAAYISEKIKKPMIYIRKQSKGFGKNQQIEGNFSKNQKAVLIEDLATDGGSKVIFVEAMRKVGLAVKDIFVIFYYDIFDFEESIQIPSSIVRSGTTYRARVRHQDEEGRWSHWSDPIQFKVANPDTIDYVNSLRITEIISCSCIQIYPTGRARGVIVTVFAITNNIRRS